MNKDIIGYFQSGIYWFSNIKNLFYIFRNGFYIIRFFKGGKSKKNIKIKSKNKNFIFDKKGIHVIKKDFKLMRKAFVVLKDRYY